MAADQDGRYRKPRRHQLAVELKAGHAWHLHVGDQAFSIGEVFRAEQAGAGLERFDQIAVRLDQARDRRPNLLVIVDDRNQNFAG
ncbi:MAG: hypothetical protein WDM85_13180 [Caulobacteraceae bacterium]